MNGLSANYQKNTGVNVKCKINSVDSASDPFEIEVNSTILVIKDNITYKHLVNQNISILGTFPQNKFSINSTVLPRFLIHYHSLNAKNMVVWTIKNGQINYGLSLKKYLRWSKWF